MRINDRVIHLVDQKPQDGTAAARAAARSVDDDAVKVGGRAREVADAQGHADAGRAERLARIATQLADGTYRVDHEQLAARIIADDLARRGGDA
ncbi:MAG: flagellar biosynthesis anti-sigma factor FlgM [Kofleriaceae bacterium]|nr:flagellar biosynthesis anti-sigma factor FlgM [Kofleriaceae bacterium]MCB9574571.1 flagellar biosynthesis anti-sigma factor FlgM [Kofleriaceae bacterium]